MPKEHTLYIRRERRGERHTTVEKQEAEAIVRDCGLLALGIYVYLDLVGEAEVERQERQLIQDVSWQRTAACLVEHGYCESDE